jgi:hypothetical protein
MIPKRRESPQGYHFWSAYHDCPWYFYLKYLMGWIPLHKGKALSKGAAIHEAMATFYKTGKPSDLMDTYIQCLEENKGDFEKPDELKELIEWGPKELLVWYNGFGHKDMEEYDVLSIEEELRPVLANGMELTIRPDRVLKKKGNHLTTIRDTKTTSYSIESSYNGVKCEDQATAYIWGLQQVHPEWQVDCLEVDVIYRRQSVIRCERPAPIFRSKYDLAQFELGVMGTMTELTQKVMSLDKYPAQMLFPRHGRNCMKWGCEYSQICRMKPEAMKIPPGFVKDALVDFSKFKIADFDIERLRDVAK